MGNINSADIEAVKNVSEQATAAYAAGDLEGFMDLFTDDVIWMPPGSEAVIGQEAVRSSNQWIENATIEQNTASSEEVVVSGDYAFERFVLTHVSEKFSVRFQGLWILRRQADGSWKIARYIFNANPPV